MEGIAALAVFLLQIYAASSQQDFTSGQVPVFGVGVFYPGRSSNALQAEVETCRAITDRISRNSARFNTELVTNTNNGINFATADSRLMSSRMQSRLDDLARVYAGRFSGRKMTVLKAWTPYPDPQLGSEQESLHYEGRTVRVRLPVSSDYDDFLELAVGEAAFDWVYYATSNFVRLSVIPSNCVRNVDCVFLLDRSGSVGRSNHNIALQFINSVVSFFRISLNSTRVGMAAYSSSSSIQFDLNDLTTSTALQNRIGQVSYTGGSTNTPAALDHARLLLNPANNRGARANSQGIPKIAILITDGRSNRGNLDAAAPALRNSGVQVYTVGIANFDVTELRTIASDPDDEHVFLLSSYLDAAGFVDFLSVTTCDTPAIIDPGDNTTTTNPDGGIKYFQAECLAFSDKILVELIDINGTSFLYCSALETNPGPLTPDTVKNETLGITRRTGIVRLPEQRKVVYIGVQGQGQSDAFTLIVWDQLFEPVDAFIDVVEGALMGVTIYEVSNNLTEATQGQTYEYSIIEGNEDGIFTIDSNTGRVSVPLTGSPGVNFDVRRTHNLTVRAINTRQDCQRARIRINIRVISNRITFGSLPEQIVPENSARNTLVVRVVATGGAGVIAYSIVSGNTNGAFSISEATGRVRVNGLLDFEQRDSYTLRVRAVSVGTTVDGEINLAIRVADVNEIHMFTTPCALMAAGCQYDVNENLQSIVLGRVVATDPDSTSSPNGTLVYSIDSVDVPFAVDATGNIRTIRSLDRETRDSYSFMLVVRDQCVSGCSFSIQTSVRVVVNDLNDNPPVYTLNRNIASLPEDATVNTVAAQYIATDADIGTNAEIIYTLTLAPNVFPFSLSPSGILRLVGALDFETTQSYMITVTASNPGDVFPTPTNTLIEVINLNDNTPMFAGEPYRESIDENSPENTLLLTVMAVDADLGVHGEIRFSIVGGNFNNSFRIGSSSGAISVRNNIDREPITSFGLEVEVKDLGTPQQRRARTTVAVTVTDVNDNPPVFQPDSYSARVREDAVVGRDVVPVIATDADEPNNPNSAIQYSIRSGNGASRFQIDANTGQIELLNLLDFETEDSYVLTVEARDGGIPVMTGLATVSVTVGNVNENPPTLTGDQVVDISESNPVNSPVAVFEALDPDQMAVTFSIVSGNGENRFQIGESSGEISLRTMLDYETTIQYSLEIRASDGQQSTTAQLTVNVLDENEFAPVFTGEDTFVIIEELPNPVTTVGTVTATDGDRDAVVSYSFAVQDSTTNLFDLDSQTGEITTRSSLDREALTQVFNPPPSMATVRITASDNGSPIMRSTRQYTITLQDINDNAPVFSDSSYLNSLMENLPENQPVFSVVASDADLGSNAVITYSFELTNNLGSTNPFAIDADTGEITTMASLDCELQPFYLFTITASDGGSPIMSTTVVGNLSVIDVNDNSPIFDPPTYRMTVSEATFPSTHILTVRATDADKGRNGLVKYRIVQDAIFVPTLESSIVVTLFRVDADTGMLFNLNQFDFESASQINLTVYADDGGIPQLSSMTTVVLDVVNVDESGPFFITTTCNAIIPEDISVGENVTECLARDLDSTATANQPPVRYSLTTPPSQYFEIDALTAKIRTISQLDRETGGGHTLTVVATDTVGHTSTRRVVIRVSDVNDNAPEFLNTPYSYHFSATAVGTLTQFLTIPVQDRDNAENGTFSLSVGNVDAVSLTESRVRIIATDSGSPQMSNSETVTVTFQRSCQLQEYAITSSGELSVSLLCSVVIVPTSLPLVLGGEETITCRIVSNSAVSYQWLHNTTSITNEVVVPGGARDVTFSVTNAQFSDAGEYACLVTSKAGSLQTVAADAFIQVSPTITTPPKETAAAIGSTAAFTCSAAGIPPPTILWLRGFDKVGEGRVLVLPEVNLNSAGTYTCQVSNAAGSASASAKLIIFDPFNVLQLDVGGISSPSTDGSCQHFDSAMLELAIGDLTQQTAVVTSVQGGDMLCEASPCSPSPCRNGGECVLNEDVVGGFECTCRQGFTGVDCTQDVAECDQDPCGAEGQCSETSGSFSCSCNVDFTGRRCQLQDVCTPALCAVGASCVETFTTEGYTCVMPVRNTSLVVGGPSLSSGELNDLIQLFIETELALSNGGRRRKRQAERLTTNCEPRFIGTGDSDELILIWLCPEREETPSAEAQQGLCNYLFKLGAVATCKLPMGEFTTPPTTPPLPSIDVKVTLIVVDSSTNKPIDALDTVKLLEDSDAEQQLSQRTGFQVSAITAQESEPRPQEGGSTSSGAGAIAGGVIAGMLIIILLVAAGVAIAVARLRSGRKRQQRKKARALQMITLEDRGSVKNMLETLESQDSTEQLLSAGGTPMMPKRPPKPSPSPSMELNDDSVYQNVTKVDLSDHNGVAPQASVAAVEGNTYDTLPRVVDEDDDANDYDNLPPTKDSQKP